MNIAEQCDHARYSDCLETVINGIGGKEVLRLYCLSDYQGEVDIDVQLEDGRVFSYSYAYGSCSGCDDWECRNLSDEEISEEMLEQATIFDIRAQYDAWRLTVTK